MTLLCRPRGRGNWKIIEVTISVAASLFAGRRGTLIQIDGMPLLRVVEVRP